MLKKLLLQKRLPLGISWEENGVRIVEMEPGRQRYRVTASFFPFPEPVLEIGCQISHHTMVKFMKEIVLEKRWRKRTVVTALPAQQVLIRNLKFPPMPKVDLHKTVTWEISQIIGGEFSDYIFDYMVTNQQFYGIEQREINVMMAAISRAKVMEFYHLFSEAGFKLQAIDVIPLALKRALVKNSQFSHDQNAVVLLDLSNCCSQLAVIEQGQLTFTRSLPYPLLEFAQNEDGQKGDSMSKPAKLILEIKKTLDFFQAESRRQVAGVIVSGIAYSPFVQFLSQDLGVQVTPGVPGNGLELDWYPDPSYAVAMGLALKGVRD